MQDKTKKQLKKGLRIGGVIGLTTLVLGGSFLLGFETGKATYQPKEEKSLSAGKPKQAFQPKRARDHIGQTSYMMELVLKKDLFLLTKDQFKQINPLKEHEIMQMTLYGNFSVANDYTIQTSTLTTFDELHIGIDYDSDKEDPKERHWLWYGNENDDYWSDSLQVLNINAISGYSNVTYHNSETHETSYTKYTPDDLLRVAIGRVTNQPYTEVNGNTNWTAMMAKNPIGMSVTAFGNEISTQPFQAHAKHMYGVEINGTYFRVYAWLGNWTVMPEHSELEVAGVTIQVPFETFQSLEYINMAIIDGDAGGTRFATNLYGNTIKKVVTDGRPLFWTYGMNSTTAKIYDWGSMKDTWNVYPNEGSGWENNTAYLKSAGADYVNATGVYIDTESGLLDVFALVGSALGGFTSILSVAILPGLTIGTLILVPFIVTMVIVIIKMLRK